MTVGHPKDERAQKPPRNRGLFPLVLLVGVALFVAGFVMTISSLSDLGGASTNSASGEALESTSSTPVSLALLIGLMLSLSGLVLATAGPAAFFIINRRKTQGASSEKH